MDTGGIKTKYDKAFCIALLKNKQSELNATNESRYPRREDFTNEEVVAIKAFLGPWPRALEAVELKQPRDTNRKRQNIDKRIMAKRKRTAAKIAKQNDST